MGETDEYVVGIWGTTTRAARLIRHGRPRVAWRIWRQEWRYIGRQARRGNWRAVRMATLKPYRCEASGPAPRCGSGWTSAGARRSLARIQDGAR